MSRRWPGRWAGYGEPRVRRVLRRMPRSATCSSLLEVSLWVVVFSLAGGDLLYAGGGSLWGLLMMVALGVIIIVLVNCVRRQQGSK